MRLQGLFLHCSDKKNLKLKEYYTSEKSVYVNKILKRITVVNIIENEFYKIELTKNEKIEITQKKGKKNSSCSFGLKDCFYGKKIDLEVSVSEQLRDKNLALFDISPEDYEKTGEFAVNGFSTGTIRIYTGKSQKYIYVLMLRDKAEHYHKMIHFKQRNEKIYFKGKYLVVDLECCIFSRWNKEVNISQIELVIDKNHRIPVEIPVDEEEGNYTAVKKKISLDSVISQETDINNPINIEITTSDGVITPYRIGFKDDTPRPLKYNFCPIASKYYKKHAMYLRGTLNQKYVFMVRPNEEIENTLGFRIKESKIVSAFLYHVIGKYKSGNKGRKINLFYEKNAMKAEEGTFQLFEKCSEYNKTSRNYFILSDKSLQWNELSKHKNVVKKYSWKYYFLLYTANNFIATEGSSHLNIIRSVNIYLRKTLLESHFVFLQHGIIYMKNLSGSTFAVDMEAEPDVFVVASEKEAEVVSPMMRLPMNRFLISGQPVFSTIEADHITSESADVVTIMLTWKDWEEYMLSSFENSSYYQYVCEVYHLLREKLSESQIRIIPHPKVHDHLLQTSLKDHVWDKSISEALKDTKLMITDYSSICYNVFYQGAGVVFYQPDVTEYEKRLGKLIPKENEYIGYRAFNKDELREVLFNGISDGKVKLDIFRKTQFVDMYHTINKYNDGKNVDRIAAYLRENSYV